jgi:hypothetical protein
VHTWPSAPQLALATAAKLVGQDGALEDCAPLDPTELHAAATKTAEMAPARKLARVGPTSIPDLYQHPHPHL